MLSLIPVGVYACDAEGRITFYNQRATELWGRVPNLYDTSEKFCACYKAFLPDGTFIPPDRTPMAIAVREGKSFKNVEAIVERPDGTRFYASINIDVLWDAAGRLTGAVNVFQDITESKNASKALRAREERLEKDLRAITLLYETGNRCARGGDDFEECLKAILDAAMSITGGQKGNIQLLDAASGALVIVTHRGFEEPFLNYFGRIDDCSKTACGVAKRSGQSVSIKDITQSEVFAGKPAMDVMLAAGARAVQSAPLVSSRGELLGVISTHFDNPHEVDERELRFMDLLARQAADYVERKRTEEVLRCSEERLRLATEAAGMFSWETNWVTRKMRWSANAAEAIGCKPEELPAEQSGSLFFVAPEDYDRLHREFADAMQAGKESYVSEFAGRASGPFRKFWMAQVRIVYDETGKPIRIVGVTQDVTKRKLAEVALRESEQRLTLSLEGGKMGMWELDFINHKTIWNDREFELLGLKPSDEPASLQLFYRRVHPEDVQALRESVSLAIETLSEWEGEFRVVTGKGDARWLAGAAQVLRGPNGKAERMIGVNYDITERKAFQAELQRLVEERTAKLQELVGELEHFSYTITHDMRAPLRAMRGFGELLLGLNGEASPQDQQRYVSRIVTAAERMDALITDALSYSKAVRQELPQAPIDLGRLLRGMLDSYPEFQPSHADITLEPDIPVVMGNEAGLTQCFSNLLDNAVKFAKPGQKPRVHIRSELREDWVRLWVEDSGNGISSELLPRVFEMFSRGASSQSGTGIGLALMRKVVDRMGGRVGVESEEGKGSRFWLELKSGDVRRQPAGGQYAAMQPASGV